MQGLEDQLLALVVNKERPDLEETKTQLIIQNTEFTIKLKQLEDELLFKLSTAEGDITEVSCLGRIEALGTWCTLKAEHPAGFGELKVWLIPAWLFHMAAVAVP